MSNYSDITGKKLLKVTKSNEKYGDTEAFDELLTIIENGHPSIDESHFCYDALQELATLDYDELIAMYEETEPYNNIR